MKSRPSDPPHIAVLGAGVIGQIYAALLHESGAHVTLLARGTRLEELRKHGVRYRCEAPAVTEKTVSVPVTDVATPPQADIVLVAVRTQHMPEALDTIAAMGNPLVVTLMNLADMHKLVEQRVESARLVLGFPGLGGFRDDSGRIVWAHVRQQPTTLESRLPAARELAALLTSAGFKTVLEDRMKDWLNIHAIFIACISVAVLRADGSPTKVAQTPQLLSGMVAAIRDGFSAYRKHHGHVRPRALGVLFGPMPARFAINYWKRELQGTVGKVTLAPHTLSSAQDEVPLICQNVKQLLNNEADVMQEWIKSALP